MKQSNKKVVDVLYNKDYNAVAPTQGYEGDFAYDIYASDGVLVPPCTFKAVAVPTGFRTAFDPVLYGMKVNLRSGTAAKTPLILANGTGIVEGTYRGGLQILVRNTFIDNRLVDFAFDVKGRRIEVKDIPKYVLQKAKEFYEEETKLLQYSGISPAIKRDIYKKLVPAGTIYVAPHDCIAQIHFAEKIHANFIESESLPESVRMENGFGSSGSSLKERKNGKRK